MSVRDHVNKYLSKRQTVRDVMIGGVGLLAFRLGHEYILIYRSRPDLLERMGASLLMGMLALLIAGVTVNRLVDAIITSVTRVANSVEQSAASQVDGAAAQARLADSQHAIAQSIQQLVGKDDRQTRNLEILLNTMVKKNERAARWMRLYGQSLGRIEEHMGIVRPEPQTTAGDNDDDE